MVRAATRDRAEQHQPVDKLGAAPGKAPGDDRAPGMRDQRDLLDAMMRGNEADHAFESAARLLGALQRLMRLRRVRHLGQGIGKRAVAMEIEAQTWRADGLCWRGTISSARQSPR